MVPLSDWYAGGEKVQIAPYVIKDSIKYGRVKLHKEINFEFAKSKSFMNTRFAELFGREYGSLNQVFPDFDGGKYDIKLPFTSPMFNNLEGTTDGLQVAYSLGEEPDYKPFVPKVTKITLGDLTTCSSFNINEGIGINNVAITSYIPFGQDFTVGGQPQTMNFGSETSTQSLAIVTDSLYATGYQDYLSSLFQAKTREVAVSAILPLPMLTRLTLDDSILIRDMKYIIKTMKTNLTTGKVDFVLLSDWNTSKATVPSKPPILTEGLSENVITVKPTKGGGHIFIEKVGTVDFVTTEPVLPATITTESEFTVTLPKNSGGDLSQVLKMTSYFNDGTVKSVEYITYTQKGGGKYLTTQGGDYIVTQTGDRILVS